MATSVSWSVEHCKWISRSASAKYTIRCVNLTNCGKIVIRQPCLPRGSSNIEYRVSSLKGQVSSQESGVSNFLVIKVEFRFITVAFWVIKVEFRIIKVECRLSNHASRVPSHKNGMYR